VASTISGLKCVWKYLASHKEGTTTNRWKHQHPKRTYCRNSTCGKVSPWTIFRDFIKPFQHGYMKSLEWRVTWQNIKVGYCFKHFYWTFVPKLKFCSNDITTSKSRILMSIDCRCDIAWLHVTNHLYNHFRVERLIRKTVV
jgi:hypothetical protein